MNFNLKQFFSKKNKEKIRNVAIIAHVDHGKTTLTDNLLAQVGLINLNLAGSQLATDYDPEQKARGITINSSAVSFMYKDHLVNLIDSPGHIDFSSQVVGALRSVDGAVLLIDVIEGIKTQTETVLGQAIKENVQIILFINKIDRLVGELKLDSKEVFLKIESNVKALNQLIKKLTDVDYNYFDLEKNVIFGSALYKWGVSIETLRQKKINFKNLLEYIRDRKSLKQFNLAQTILDSCIATFPEPGVHQKQKLRRIYQEADLESDFLELDQGFLNGDINVPFKGMVTDVNYDKHSGLLYTVRVLAGSYEKSGQTLYSNATNFETFKPPTRILVTMIKKFEEVDNCFSGTVVVFQGSGALSVGDTLTTDVGFKKSIPGLKYIREAVVSVSIQPKKVTELKKMLDSLQLLVLEDPTLTFNYEEESKQFILSGVGALQLQVSLKKLENTYGVETTYRPPVVNYSETLAHDSTRQVSVRTPNKHNDFKFYLFKLPESLCEKLLKKEVSAKNLVNEVLKSGVHKDLAKKATKILPHGCVYFDDTKGASFMEECKDNISRGITLALSTGIRLKKPFKGLGFVLTFSKIHEDNLHRGYIQLRSAYREGLETIFKQSSTVITQPIMEVTIDTPYRYSTQIINQVVNRRGLHQQSCEADLSDYLRLKCVIPLAQTLDLSPKMMALSEGRAMFNLSLKGYQKVSKNVLENLINKKII